MGLDKGPAAAEGAKCSDRHAKVKKLKKREQKGSLNGFGPSAQSHASSGESALLHSGASCCSVPSLTRLGLH